MPFGSNALRKNEPLSRHTTFRIGGPALFWYEPVSDELEAIFGLASRAGLPLLALGGGSNCLVNDRGFDGVVVRLSDISSPACDSNNDTGVIVSGCSNTSWDWFVDWCCAQGYQGVECLAGIPGTVGGAVFGAIGAYGQQIADVVEWVDELDVRSGQRRRRQATDITFGYRFSDYSQHLDTVILQAGFRLRTGTPTAHAHPEIASLLPATSTLLETAAGVRRIRERKGAMLWLPHRGHNRTAGSFFKNPTLSETSFNRLCEQLDIRDARKWWWPLSDGYRVSAARLIEHTGFKRGHHSGDAAISPEHTLSLVNLGNAKAADILGLAARIRDAVHERCHVALEPEVRMIGFDSPPLT
jgi:UDP-N-acetylmuramate dehydrogenase